jgi:hypothetical protein
MHMRMHLTAALLLLSSSVPLAAAPAKDKDYEWIDAKVIDITTESRGAAVVPLVALTGGPTTKTYYLDTNRRDDLRSWPSSHPKPLTERDAARTDETSHRRQQRSHPG